MAWSTGANNDPRRQLVDPLEVRVLWALIDERLVKAQRFSAVVIRHLLKRALDNGLRTESPEPVPQLGTLPVIGGIIEQVFEQFARSSVVPLCMLDARKQHLAAEDADRRRQLA